MSDKQENPFTILDPFLNDPTILEVLIDKYDCAYVERDGTFEDVASPFTSNEHFIESVQAMADYMGVTLNSANPLMDIRLPDGSRMNVVLPPISILGTSLVLRKFFPHQLTLEDLYKYGSISPEIADFVKACVQGRLNIIIAGGTASGKTTFLNIITEFIGVDERVVTVENAGELQPRTNPRRIVRLESRPADGDGKGEVTMSDLIINALRMRPDRLILGEARAGEVIHFLQAINTGHDGSMLTMHANNPRDALARLETMAIMFNPSLPILTVRQQIASGFDLIVQAERLSDGRRKVMAVSEVVGMQGDNVQLQDIFKFEQTGMDNGRIQGKFVPTGYIPTFVDHLRDRGIHIPVSNFTPQGAN